MKKLTLGIVAHVDAGKTTLSESLLYLSGSIRTMGRVDHRDTYLDTYELERERGITIFSKQARFAYKQMQVVLLDTPGHVDFSAEMERTLQVLDYAILVISGLDGVQGHTKTLWKLLERYQVPTFLFVNKMDIAHLKPKEILEQLQGQLHDSCVDFTEFIENNFHNTAHEGNGDFTGEEYVAAPQERLEELAMCDETMLDSFMETGCIYKKDLVSAIAQRGVFPCLFGAALQSQGVEELLEMINDYTGSPVYGKSFGARVYKIGRDEQGKRITYMKITGGSLQTRDVVEIPGSEMGVATEKVNQIRLYGGEKYESVPRVEAGEICGVTGLSLTCPGQGLGVEPPSNLPLLEPVLHYQVLTSGEVSPQVMMQYLRELEEEDPMLHVEWKESLQEIHLKLMGPVQVEILQQQIKERFGVLVTFDAGNIVYKETIAEPVVGVGHFEPLRHYGEVHLLLEPLSHGEGMQFASNCREDELDKNWQRLILTHLEEKEHLGVLTGSPITDMKMTLVAGRAHKKHTEGGDFRQATYRAVRQGLKKARSVLLEPYYKFCLDIPIPQVGRAMTDLQQKHAVFGTPQSQGERTILEGRAPVSEMTNYHTQVNAYTSGTGQLSLELLGYYPCHNQDEIVANISYDSEADIANPTGSVFCAHGAGFIVPWFEVEEYMHMEHGISLENEEEQKDVLLVAKNASRPKEERGYDGYGGLESDLEEIFVREFGEIKRRPPGQQVQVRDYSRQQEAREEYFRTHGAPETNSQGIPVERYRKRQEARKSYFLVDGYNVIFAWEDLKELSKVSLDGARGRLMDIMCNYQGFIGSELILVFDAYKVKGNPGSVEDYHNIHVVYTREAETADAYIEKVTHDMGKNHDVTVATSDALEQMIVIGEGARRMSSRELLEDVRRVAEEGMEKYRGWNLP